MIDIEYWKTYTLDSIFWTITFSILIVGLIINVPIAIVWYIKNKGQRPINEYSLEKEMKHNNNEVKKYGYAYGK